jgi:hypothetical protein
LNQREGRLDDKGYLMRERCVEHLHIFVCYGATIYGIGNALICGHGFPNVSAYFFVGYIKREH